MDIFILLGIVLFIIILIVISYENVSKTDKENDIGNDNLVDHDSSKDNIIEISVNKEGFYKSNENNSKIDKENDNQNNNLVDYDSSKDNIIENSVNKEGFFKIIQDKQQRNLIKELISEYLLFEESFKERYERVVVYYDNTINFNPSKRSTDSVDNRSFFPLNLNWSYNEPLDVELEILIKKIEDTMNDRKGCFERTYFRREIYIEIDLHNVRKNDAKIILDKLMKCLKKYVVRLTIIHGYNSGTILRDFVRNYKDPSIEITVPINNEGRTIYNISNIDLINSSCANRILGEDKEKAEREREEKVRKSKEKQEKEIKRKHDIEKLFKEYYPNIYERREHILKRLKMFELSAHYINAYSEINEVFEKQYKDIKLRFSINSEDEYSLDSKESMFDDFFFDSLGRRININDNDVTYYFGISGIVREHILDNMNKRLKLKEDDRARKLEIEREKREKEIINRPKKLKDLVDNFHKIKVNSIIYHKKHGILTVKSIKDNILTTTDENGSKRRFINDPKILDFIDDIKF